MLLRAQSAEHRLHLGGDLQPRPFAIRAGALDLILVVKSGGTRVRLTVITILAKDVPSIDRPGSFPVGEPLEIMFTSDYRTIVRAAPLALWQHMQKTKDSRTVFAGVASMSHAGLARLSRLRKLAITDGFPNAVRDVSISTEHSTAKLPCGAGLLLRTGRNNK